MNLFLFISFVLGLILFVNSATMIGIISRTIGCRFGYVIDADLQKKINILDGIESFMHLSCLILSIFMLTLIIGNVISLSVNVYYFGIIACALWLLKGVVSFIVFKLYKVEDTYNEIQKQWLTEKKISKRHDEEVSFIQGVDTIQRTWFPDICWLISIILLYIYA